MVESNQSISRRKALKKAGAIGLGSLTASTIAISESDIASAAYKVYDKTIKSTESNRRQGQPQYDYCHGTETRVVRQQDPDTPQWIFHVTVGTHNSAKWAGNDSNRNGHPNYFEHEFITINYDPNGAYNFPRNKYNIVSHNYRNNSNADLIKDGLDGVIDFASNFAGIYFNVAKTTADYLYGWTSDYFTDNTKHESEWHYNSWKWRSGVYRKFEIRADPGEIIEFTTKSELATFWGPNIINRDNILLIAPSH